MVLAMDDFSRFTETASELWAKVLTEGLAPTGRVILILLLAWLFAKFLRRLVRRALLRISDLKPVVDERVEQRTKALTALSSSVISVVVWTIAVLTSLGTLGINLAPLVAGAGIAGVALGFGAQSLVRDFLSGVLMLIEDQYGVGDVIDVAGTIGEVESVSLRTTRLRGVDGTVWHIPNGEITKVGNLSQDWSRIILDVAVAYKSDLNFTQKELAKILKSYSKLPGIKENILEEPEIWGVQNLGDNSIDIRISIKVKAGTQWALTRRLREEVKNHFDEANIEIPFPQLSVWIEKSK